MFKCVEHKGEKLPLKMSLIFHLLLMTDLGVVMFKVGYRCLCAIY